ncbi:hypothetical protein TBCH5v1_2253 [Thermococcus barophilus]|uniref:Sulfatase N-terminal domain-containing protein n=2 Tax=Thermococcus barophilus TaxID=55802 RepID=A0A0S1XEB6_THEBA|nr:hypothetical protein TBCH5v1_2253 [Thermococcus barophilus]
MLQTPLILRKDWDILIILDACRYDYFRDLNSKYFPNAVPMKVISPASNTYEWAKKVLEPHIWSDVVYVSANPWINSKIPVKDLDVRGKFFRIYDAWLYNWDDKKNTVWPDELTDVAIRLINKYKDKKFIIHYIQPHAPYLSLDIEQSSPFPLTGGDIGNKKTTLQRLEDFVVYKLLPRPLFKAFLKWRYSKGLPIGGPEFVAFANLSLDEWREAYMKNLEIALRSVRKLISRFNYKNVIITADHGELLGDRFWFGYKVGHPAFVYYKELVEVPWLEVKG